MKQSRASKELEILQEEKEELVEEVTELKKEVKDLEFRLLVEEQINEGYEPTIRKVERENADLFSKLMTSTAKLNNLMDKYEELKADKSGLLDFFSNFNFYFQQMKDASIKANKSLGKALRWIIISGALTTLLTEVLMILPQLESGEVTLGRFSTRVTILLVNALINATLYWIVEYRKAS